MLFVCFNIPIAFLSYKFLYIKAYKRICYTISKYLSVYYANIYIKAFSIFKCTNI